MPIKKLIDVKKDKGIFYTYVLKSKLDEFIVELEKTVSSAPTEKKFKARELDSKKVEALRFDNIENFEYEALLRRIKIIYDKYKKANSDVIKYPSGRDEPKYKDLVKEKEKFLKDIIENVDIILNELKNYTDDEDVRRIVIDDNMPDRIGKGYDGLIKIVNKRYEEIKDKPTSSKITEMSSTGGGAPAAAQATYTPGSGEGVAQKYAFAPMKKRKDENHDLSKKYKQLFKKEIKDL